MKSKIEDRDEHTEQVRFIELVDLYTPKYPQLEMVYANPNGALRHKVVAAKLKAEGVRPGVPDINIDYPSRGYHGMRIEMKRQHGGRVTAHQKEWKCRLEKNGYLWELGRGCSDAWSKLCWYLKINP